ncbi:MAG: hypothetical protein JO035_10385 [Betaproteobacteria bacterium]|nr:hypothetical protein [Betaproteobacteria bacterium]
MKKAVLFLGAVLASTGALAKLDLNGVALGASEKEVKKSFPSALCKPLEWKSAATDRRCDDSKISLAGVEARVTFYLKNDAVQAFDLRFNTSDLDKVMPQLKSRYGKPSAETKDTIEQPGKEPRVVYKVLWEQGKDRASLVAQMDKKRVQLTASRGNWEEEIYRIR